MSNLKVTVAQTSLHWESPEANRAMLEEKLAGVADTDVIVLPEMFTTGFTMNATALAEPMNLYTTKWMQNMAAKTGALILGSVVIKEGSKFFNRLIWMQPDGGCKTYDKRHLFRMAEEEKVYTAGSKVLIGEWKGWRICPLVCYDLRFPVWSRNQFNHQTQSLSYDLLVYVANWPAARSVHWQTLLKARAIENQSYVAGVNRVGADGKGIQYDGHSTIISPKGEALFEIVGEECVQTATLNKQELIDWRTKFPAYFDSDGFEIKP
jgi:predicted amidohydrolase